jgi:MORN repeat variant
MDELFSKVGRPAMIKKAFISFFVLFIANRACAQKTSDIGTAYHRISFEIKDTLFQFYVSKPLSDQKIVDDAVYYWFTPDTILQTVGGYQGKLLNGLFTKYYPNKNIAVKESYDMGRKSGESRSWFPDGKLESIVTWSMGKKAGPFKMYDSSSRLIQYGSYKNDKLDGSIFSVSDGGKIKKEKYRKGVLELPENNNNNANADAKDSIP